MSQFHTTFIFFPWHRPRSSGNTNWTNPARSILDFQTSECGGSHHNNDFENELQDRILAGRLRRSTRLPRQARANLRRWKVRDGGHPRRVFMEWQRILDHLSAKEIADFW